MAVEPVCPGVVLPAGLLGVAEEPTPEPCLLPAAGIALKVLPEGPVPDMVLPDWLPGFAGVPGAALLCGPLPDGRFDPGFETPEPAGADDLILLV